MAAGVGIASDVVTFEAALAETPYRYDFYQTLRRLECLHADRPRWGCAVRPAEEAVRLGQDPDLSFAPAPLASYEPERDGRPARLQVRLFGLLGPNGPLPIHLTECARERLRHAGDPALSRFLDLFHHRFLALLYRAWAQAQPHVNRDRPAEDRFAGHVAALIGLEPESFYRRDAVPDVAKLFHAGALIRPVRSADGLSSILADFFGVPARLEQFIGHWMTIDGRDRTCLAGTAAALGRTATVGGRVWDRQHKFRVRLGPLTLDEYTRCLPGGAWRSRLRDWVRLYFDDELEWDAQLVLRQDAVPPPVLGCGVRLGWTTWLGTRHANGDADDLCIQAASDV